MPASEHSFRRTLTPLLFVLVITASLLPSHAAGAAVPSSSSSVSVSLLFNYGNGTLEWHNNTAVPPTWNFYNVTVADANGNVAALFFASFGSHFVYLINELGCPTVFGCDVTWSFWVLQGPCWTLPPVGVDQVQATEGSTGAWFLVPLSTFGQNPPTGTGCVNASIDVRPGSDANPINIKSAGVIPVALLSTDSLDASKINPSSTRFGPTGTEAQPATRPSFQDLNGDGSLDLVLSFRTQDTGFKAGDTQAVLTGTTADGIGFLGTDTVHVFFPGD